LTGGELLAHAWQVDEHHVAEGVGGVFGDADGGDITVDAEPIVVGV